MSATSSLLEERFEQAWRGVGALLGGATLHEALLAAYAEPHRKYHSLQHLGECLSTFNDVRHLAERPAEIEIALWFHDAVYDTRRHDNEALSADWARRKLGAASAPADAIDRIDALIMVTRHTGVPTLPDQQLLVDVDLSILGASEARFAEYEQQIREEYAFVPEPVFKLKRGEILQSFLARPRIYGTEHFHKALDQRARVNLALAIRP